ncbi:MAG: hypothetical protein IMZ55_04440 [Acidobacteria bacterium]|nr:hypothetical protein [Acidobacteriota bacterium]
MDVGNTETLPGSSSSHPLDPGGFAPGTILADRYRIVALVAGAEAPSVATCLAGRGSWHRR